MGFLQDPHPAAAGLVSDRGAGLPTRPFGGPDNNLTGYQDNTLDSTPPRREYSPSAASSCDSFGGIHDLGENYPVPSHSAKDFITVHSVSRCDLAMRWSDASVRSRDLSPCPMPWDTCDLGLVEPVVFPDKLFKVWKFKLLDSGLRLDYRGLNVWVRATSDLAVTPWSTCHRRAWPSYMAEARAICSEFVSLVHGGQVRLVDRQPPRGTTLPSVVFDLPILASEGEVLDGREPRQLSIGSAWRSMTRAFRDVEAPAWLSTTFFCPVWWPHEAFHGRRLTVNAFLDGSIAPAWDDLCGGSDRAVLIGDLCDRIQLYAYVTDLYDEANYAIWLDGESIMRCPQYSRAGAYIIGTDGRSAFLDGVLAAELQRVDAGRELHVIGYPSIQYPKQEACRRVCFSLSHLRPGDSYGQLGRNSRMSTVQAIRTMAWSPFYIPLHPMGNCVLEVFRDCSDSDGFALGPISHDQIVAGELVDAFGDKLRTTLGEKWLSIDGNHIFTVPDKALAAPRTSLNDKYGKESVDSIIASCPLSLQCGEPENPDVTVKFSEPDEAWPNNEASCDLRANDSGAVAIRIRPGRLG